MNILTQPWPWYVAGPLIGLMVPLLLLAGNKAFGISSTLRHICAACIPTNAKFFKYDWKAESWNLIFALGMVIGGLIAGYFFKNPDPINLSESAIESMNKLGIKDYSGLIPGEVFSFSQLLTVRGFLLMIVGGFFIGFGTRYAGGCTSGHAIMGLSNLQFPSLIATCCFFAGGLIMTWLILPFVMNL
ncbi:MAG: YeeE/YedE family protein [Bacteroidetes bacterium]|nr:YeeE/YedE family protein [Bacteroidota bacterium]